jgi:predicted CxxxxCH...CXXCH cytochrome family protein
MCCVDVSAMCSNVFCHAGTKGGHLSEDDATAKDWDPFRVMGDEISL